MILFVIFVFVYLWLSNPGIHNDISSRRPLRQGTSEEPAEQPGSAVSRHHSEQRSMRGWFGLMSLCIKSHRLLIALLRDSSWAIWNTAR